MGNACCGPAEPEHKPQQTEGELAGKMKFLSTPSFCEYTDNNAVSKVPGDNKWFLCVFAPLGGHGIAFTAYQNKTNTLMVKYLVDAEIVKEKEQQNISISYNMFFKALSTEVARAGRVGAKVTFASADKLTLDCKIMIAGATSRRPDNFGVDLHRIDVTPDALYHYVLEPICTQYYKRRANEGWNVERVDISREKIYGEYETNYILRSTRLDSNLEMLREIAPRVLQLRREQALLRERREKLLAQLCIARTLLSTENPLPDRLVRAIPKDERPSDVEAKLSPALLQSIDRPSNADLLYVPAGGELSSIMPNLGRPVPKVLPEKTEVGGNASPKAGGTGSSVSAPSTIAPPSFVSRNVIEVCLEMGKNLPADLHNYEVRHTSPQNERTNLQTPSSRRGGGSMSGTSTPLASRLTRNGEGGSGVILPHQHQGDVGMHGSFSGTNITNIMMNSANLGTAELRDEEYYAMDVSVLKPALQAKFHQNLANDNEKTAVFRCWRAFLSVTRFDPITIEALTNYGTNGNEVNNMKNFKSPASPAVGPSSFNTSGAMFGHSLAITFAMALGLHKLPEQLGLSLETVHDLCIRLEQSQSRQESYFNAMKAADRVQYMSLFLKVVQSGEVPRMAKVPPIEKLCALCAAAGCRTDLHPSLEPYGQPSSTLAALHVDSLNERHSLAVTITALRQCKGLQHFITSTFHKLLADLILSLDPARHNVIFGIFAQRVKAATNFSRSLEERRLMYSVLLIGADCAFFSRNSDIKELWTKKMDTSVTSIMSNFKRTNAVCFYTKENADARSNISNGVQNNNSNNKNSNNNNLNNGDANNNPTITPTTSTNANSNTFAGPQSLTFLFNSSATVGAAGQSGHGLGVAGISGRSDGEPQVSLADLRTPLKINLPSTFRIGSTAGFGNVNDDVLPSSLILRSEMRAGFTGGSSPACMQGITRKSHEMYEQIAVPAFNCLKSLAQEAVEAHRRNDGFESSRDGSYAIFTRIARSGLF